MFFRLFKIFFNLFFFIAGDPIQPDVVAYHSKKKGFFSGSLRWSWCIIAPLPYKEPVKPSLVLLRFFSGSSVVLCGS